MEPSSTSASRSPSAPGSITVAVVHATAEGNATYVMFETSSVTPEGAVLTGGLLLEIGEEITLEVRLPGRVPVRARARVVSILSGELASMQVAFVGLDDAARQRLSGAVRAP